ncbi:cAMP-regulated phosphoprotein 21-like isoform X5 [Haliotis rufescens]|uniref:cAMP-regulated phosphoprotein 21-like isoform X5 n=1 Tax=Haliotis rufescens TaxID=6454 RepID=UPI001EB03694|nr:cAMP-regulated phosphoprotein 21-like isoform X5 [Haliotis rufescens]
MTMAESERRSGKTPLKKQPEIEEVEEGDEETNGSPNSDVSDTTITPGIETPVAQSATGSPDSETGDEQTASPCDGKSDIQEHHQTVRTNSQSKMKTLQRAEALCDDSSPPPDVMYPIEHLESKESKIRSERRLEKSGSQSSEAGTSSSLSRESSLDTQYKDSTGIDLEEFIKRTLNKSVKDKKMILQLARDLKKFVKEPKHQFLQFAEMSSYDRMLVHRIAAFFGLDHNVDQSGKAVIVSKTKITRIPDFCFEDHIQKGGDMGTKKKILPRKAPSLDEKESKGLEKHLFGSNRAKSLEERQKSYEEAKARIFKNGEGGSEDYLSCAPLVSNSRSGKSSLVSSKEDLGSRQPSTDSSGYGSCENTGKQSRLSIQKANSYGGMPGHPLVKSHGSASFSKADSVSSGTSGSFDCGSGRPYPVPTSPPGSQSDHSPLSRSSSTGPVPSPHTSVQPHVNPDGSLYRYDPAQPPPWLPSAGSSVHPSTPSSTSFPNSLPTQYSSVCTHVDQDTIHQFSNMHMSTDIIDSLQQRGPAPHTQQGSHIMMSTQQPYQSQPPYIQPTYYPGPQGVTGQPVRYTYQVPYQMQSQSSMDSQPQPHPANVPHIGQYSQAYVQGYPTTNYPNVVVQQSASQSADMSASSNVSQTGVYTGPHQDSNVPSYSIQYSPYSQQQQQQSSYGQQAQSPVFYSVSSTNPQLGYSFTGPTGSTIRPTTPPSQGNNIPNPSIAINMAQPVNFQQQASGSGGGHSTATSPQYGTYYPQLHQQAAAAIRPVNQVMQIAGVQSHATPGPSTQQPFSIVRPSMQVGLPAGNIPPQAGSIGQHAVGYKGYSINTCFQKQSVGGDGSKDTAPTPTVLPGNLSHITGHMPSGSSVRPQQLGTGDMRMYGQTFRPQLQPLQLQRATGQQPPNPQQPKPRE